VLLWQVEVPVDMDTFRATLGNGKGRGMMMMMMMMMVVVVVVVVMMMMTTTTMMMMVVVVVVVVVVIMMMTTTTMMMDGLRKPSPDVTPVCVMTTAGDDLSITPYDEGNVLGNAASAVGKGLK
jgi:hypothetical protein